MAKLYAFTLARPNRVDLGLAADRGGRLLSLDRWKVQLQPPPLYPKLIKEPACLILWRGTRNNM